MLFALVHYIQEYLPLEKKSINHQSAILSNLMGTKPFPLTILIIPHRLFILHHHRLSQAQSLRTRNLQYQTARPIPSTNAST